MPDMTASDWMKTDVVASITDIMDIPVNGNDSNFELDYRVERIDTGKDIWAVRKTIVLTTEELDDEVASQNIIAKLTTGSTGSTIGGLALVKHDHTGASGDAWTGSFLDAS